jgi:hypothetical protein
MESSWTFFPVRLGEAILGADWAMRVEEEDDVAICAMSDIASGEKRNGKFEAKTVLFESVSQKRDEIERNQKRFQ